MKSRAEDKSDKIKIVPKIIPGRGPGPGVQDQYHYTTPQLVLGPPGRGGVTVVQ
jgi:hypothetical protein